MNPGLGGRRRREAPAAPCRTTTPLPGRDRPATAGSHQNSDPYNSRSKTDRCPRLSRCAPTRRAALHARSALEPTWRTSLRTLARWCVAHRRTVLAGWLVALVGLAVISQSAGTAYRDSFSLNGTQSFEALALLEKSAPKASGDVEQVVHRGQAWTCDGSGSASARPGDAREGRGAARRGVRRIAVRADAAERRSRRRARSRSRT